MTLVSGARIKELRSTEKGRAAMKIYRLATVTQVAREGHRWLVQFDCGHIVSSKADKKTGARMHCAVCLGQLLESVRMRVVPVKEEQHG